MTTLVLCGLLFGGLYLIGKLLKKATNHPDVAVGAGKVFWKLLKK
jgi:hypothetical protein